MKTYRVPQTELDVSRIAYGCMKIGGSWDSSPIDPAQVDDATDVVMAAYEQGITLFDHADIYTHGKSEEVFGKILKAHPRMREEIVLQSKCGIRFPNEPEPGAPQRYDFSYDHIINSVEGSLRRLQTDHLDVLLLHRPDPLVAPEEVARAFDELHDAGKVRYFGVSNHTAEQIELLQAYVDQPLVVNQVQLSLLHAQMINAGIVFNREGAEDALTTGTLDYCRLHGILVQAWGPVAGGRLFNPPPSAPDNVREVAAVIEEMALENRTTEQAIALAWLLRHPAGIQPIIGTTRPERVEASVPADDVELSREDWYRLFIAARGENLP